MIITIKHIELDYVPPHLSVVVRGFWSTLGFITLFMCINIAKKAFQKSLKWTLAQSGLVDIDLILHASRQSHLRATI